MNNKENTGTKSVGTLNKKFKEWEKQFSRAEVRQERKKWHIGSPKDLFIKWPYVVDQWTQDSIKYCVYEAPDAKDWQRFRCCLKGLSTLDKLLCLNNRWRLFEGTSAKQLEKCRIDNYLGALVRGGFLNHNLEIIK